VLTGCLGLSSGLEPVVKFLPGSRGTPSGCLMSSPGEGARAAWNEDLLQVSGVPLRAADTGEAEETTGPGTARVATAAPRPWWLTHGPRDREQAPMTHRPGRRRGGFVQRRRQGRASGQARGGFRRSAARSP